MKKNVTASDDSSSMHPRRHKEMHKTRKIILGELKKIRDVSHWGKEIDACVFKMFERKADKIGVRGYFIRKIYEYVVFLAQQEKIDLRKDIPENVFTIKLPFLVEAVISLQYLDNQILDQKGGVKTPQKINQNLLASKLFGLFLRRDYVHSSFPLSMEDKGKVASRLDTMFELVDLGQCLEKRYGSYTSFVKGLPKDKTLKVGKVEPKIPHNILKRILVEIKKDGIPRKQQRFVFQYLKRVYLCSGSLFVLAAEIVMDLLGYNGKEKKNILQFASYYGIVLQFVNDNNDYFPCETVEKNVEDAFSDLRNETMSLPLIYYLTREDGEKNLDVLKSKLLKSEKEALHHLLEVLEEYSIPLTKRIALMAVKFLNQKYVDYELLADMVSIAHGNKYYRFYTIENTNLKC